MQNDFGHMSSKYEKARRGYPAEVFSYLKSLIKTGGNKVLDLGCGTGISARELYEKGFSVTGADKDAKMVEVAKSHNNSIKYVIAPADKLPFPDDYFDIVTAFTAFHWFNDKESLSEIKRALKPSGLFFAALKGNHEDHETEKFRKGYMEILEKYAGAQFDKTQEHFVYTILLESGFTPPIEKSFIVDELYSVEEALILLQSLSLWNLISKNKQSLFLEEMKHFYESNLVDGMVLRRREIFTLACYK